MAVADGTTITSLPVFSGKPVGTEELIVTNVAGETKRVATKDFFGLPPYAGAELAAVTTLNLIDLVSEVVGTGTIALPVGTNDMFKIVTASVLTGSVTITCSDGIGFTEVILTATGNSVTFYYLNGWRVISKNIG